MSVFEQIDLSDALHLGDLGSPKRFVDLPNSVCFGDVVSGGFIASLLAKHAILYASQRPTIKDQSDIRSSLVSFYRPVFAHAGSVVLELDEVSIGKSWSTLRVRLFQGSKAQPAASADICVWNLSRLGINLNTGWRLFPPPLEADLNKLSTDNDPRWTLYHPQFKANGARRAYAYIKFFIPSTLPTDLTYVEQWITPGWDCYPSGSRNPSLPEARWTNDLIHFVLDCSLPIMENFHRSNEGQRPLGSIEATLNWARLQKDAREAGKPDWRALKLDGSLEDKYGDTVFKDSYFHGTMSMSTEIKKKLPEEGVRWLYMRSEAKSIVNGRMDNQALLFDEKMELVAISHHVVQLLSGDQKTRKKPSL